jgi:hypothetical protein
MCILISFAAHFKRFAFRIFSNDRSKSPIAPPLPSFPIQNAGLVFAVSFFTPVKFSQIRITFKVFVVVIAGFDSANPDNPVILSNLEDGIQDYRILQDNFMKIVIESASVLIMFLFAFRHVGPPT